MSFVPRLFRVPIIVSSVQLLKFAKCETKYVGDLEDVYSLDEADQNSQKVAGHTEGDPLEDVYSLDEADAEDQEIEGNTYWGLPSFVFGGAPENVAIVPIDPKTTPWIEPYTYTRFHPTLKVAKQETKNKVSKETLQFVGAGLRCMLGESALCHRKATRVYTFGLYVNKGIPGLGTGGAPDYETHVLKPNNNLVKSLRLYVNVSKTGKHWSTGFKQSLGRRIRRKYREFGKETVNACNKDLLRFCKIWRQNERVPPGTEIVFTWADGKLNISVNGVIKHVTKNQAFAEALFRMYLDTDSVNAAVAKTIRKNWYKKYDLQNDHAQAVLRKRNSEEMLIHENSCILKGYNKDLFCSSNIAHQNRSTRVKVEPTDYGRAEEDQVQEWEWVEIGTEADEEGDFEFDLTRDRTGFIFSADKASYR